MASNDGDIEVYRTRAAQCISLAQEMPATEPKIALLDMARAWLLLAEQAAKNGQTTLVYETPTPRITEQQTGEG